MIERAPQGIEAEILRRSEAARDERLAKTAHRVQSRSRNFQRSRRMTRRDYQTLDTFFGTTREEVEQKRRQAESESDASIPF